MIISLSNRWWRHNMDTLSASLTLCEWNWPIWQIPQCIRQIFHNTLFCNRNVHTYAHFCYKKVALWDMGRVHLGINATGLFIHQPPRGQGQFDQLIMCHVQHIPRVMQEVRALTRFFIVWYQWNISMSIMFTHRFLFRTITRLPQYLWSSPAGNTS